MSKKTDYVNQIYDDHINFRTERKIISAILNNVEEEQCVCANQPSGYYEKHKIHLINFNDIVKSEIKSLKAILRKKLSDAKQRCENPKANSFKSYGGRGITVDCNLEELLAVWIRDDGYLLQRASLDRIDNDRNYVLNNIRFIEAADNLRKRNKSIDINITPPDLINLESRVFDYVSNYLSPMKIEIEKRNSNILRQNYKMKLMQQFKNLTQYREKSELELADIVEQCLTRMDEVDNHERSTQNEQMG